MPVAPGRSEWLASWSDGLTFRRIAVEREIQTWSMPPVRSAAGAGTDKMPGAEFDRTKVWSKDY
jgi:hypothetical protein